MPSLGKIAAKNWETVQNADVHVMLEVGDQYLKQDQILYSPCGDSIGEMN